MATTSTTPAAHAPGRAADTDTDTGMDTDPAVAPVAPVAPVAGHPPLRAPAPPGAQAGPGTVTVRYWAAAKAAAGVATQVRPAGTVAQILAGARADHPDLERVLAVASVLLDGRPAAPERVVPPGATLEVLPPFAGG